MLKKKKDLKDCVINTVLDRTQAEGKTVKKIMEVLGEKFMKTFAEKTQVLIEKIVKLQQIVLLMERLDDITTFEKIKKIHENMNHKLEENIWMHIEILTS